MSPCRERHAERASHEQTSQQRANETICAAYSLGDAPSKYPAELLLVSISVTKRRSGGRYLLVIMRARGIGVGKVDFCDACDQEEAKVHNLPFGRFPGPLLSCRNRCAALSPLIDLATTMSRCQRSAAPATESMFLLQGVLCGRLFSDRVTLDKFTFQI